MNIKLCTVNLITMLRVIGTILLIPIYHVYGSLTTGIFSLICNLTDILDGTLARKWKVSTFFGSLFDSASDKIFLKNDDGCGSLELYMKRDSLE